MAIRLIRLLRREEDGMAMMIAVILTGVLATLTLLMLTVGSHTDVASARGRHWIQALHVAESGVDQAIAKIQAGDGAFTGSFTGTTDEGSYTASVSRSSRNVYTIDVTGSVRAGSQLSATRELQVTMAPPSTFRNAVYSFTSLETKNNDVILGDAWANQNIVLADNSRVTGSVTAATGYIVLNNGAIIEGNAQSGGYNSDDDHSIYVGPNGRIGGWATASVTAPPDPVTCGGTSPDKFEVYVSSGGNIAGDVTTWGTKDGAGTVGPPGIVKSNTCTPAPASISMPVFTYNELNYDAATLHEFGDPSSSSATAVADFHNWLNAQPGREVQGTFYINQSGVVSQTVRLDLTGVVITGDTTIITNTPIYSNGMSDSTSDAIVFLASYYKPPTNSTCDINQDGSECSIHLKNNFAPSGATALLAYSPYGPTAIKNNASQTGAVYGDSVQVKNNQTLTYDARIERVVGFGDTHLEIIKWIEV